MTGGEIRTPTLKLRVWYSNRVTRPLVSVCVTARSSPSPRRQPQSQQPRRIQLVSGSSVPTQQDVSTHPIVSAEQDVSTQLQDSAERPFNESNVPSSGKHLLHECQRAVSRCREPSANMREICDISWRFLTSGDNDVWHYELKIGTPVTPTLGNICTNFDFSARSCFRARNRRTRTDRQTYGRTG